MDPKSRPLCERLREALQDFKKAAHARARLEVETESTFRENSRALETEHQASLERIESAHREGMSAAQRQVDEARTSISAQFDGDSTHATLELEKAKRGALHRYAQAKERAQSDFYESRWTVTTVYDAGKKVAKDKVTAAQTRAKSANDHLQHQQQIALQLLQHWKFANDLPLMDSPSVAGDKRDPWEALELCTAQSAEALSKLQALKLPGYVRGLKPFLLIGLVWLLASLPALMVLRDWNVVYWLAATTGIVLPCGLLIRWWLKALGRSQAVALWCDLCQAGIDATYLRPRCVEAAKRMYRDEKNRNKHQNEKALTAAAVKTRNTIKALRKERNQKLRHAQATYDPLIKKLTRRRDRGLQEAEEIFTQSQTEITARHEQELSEANDRYKSRRDEINRRHADDWTRLVDLWKQGCDRFSSECRAVDQETRRWFAPWNDPAWNDPQLPTEVPLGLYMGDFHVRLEDIPDGVPKEKHLQKPDLSVLRFPVLLPFPERASLLFKASDTGKSQAIASLQDLLLRCWSALPAGKARCTIMDPVGRGENFAAFMHLADYEEALVNSRIWTESAHIDQRLTDLTTHMENVLQKYLRNQYETLAEYNAQAGEVAEPYRFLVVADFPVNFTPDAARRLISLAGAGARCGIYTFIMVDTKQELPQGIDLADLERVSTIFSWKRDRFIWHDQDFGSFPLQLEAPPDDERSTRILQVAGEEAKRAARVEVPFGLIAIPHAEWWQGDSRAGLSVPLGRAGATARQLLTLGQGTSQHVLIAGKTGSGKSTLLHVLIAQLAMRYSPNEVELFLIDFKKGVEFKTYAANQLPHARVVAIESEREFGLSVLQRLDAELVRRGELFRVAGVNDLPSYRNLPPASGSNGQPHSGMLPRLVLVVDEFQEFFVEDDKLAQETALLLDRLVRQGRAFGIHIILGSQTLGGAYSLARSTIDQMAVRIALQCSETDAHLILSKDNSDARLLSRPGEAIYNASGGLLEGNHLFQVVWLNDDERDSCLTRLSQLGEQHLLQPQQIVFEGTAPSDMTKNALLAQALAQPVPRGLADPYHAWLGESVAIKDPTAAIFRRQSGSNLIMIGQQDELAFSMQIAALAALTAQLPAMDAENSCLNMVVANPLEGAATLFEKSLPEVLPVRMVSQRDLGALLNRLADEMNRRLKGEGDGPPQFLFLHGMQRLRDLRRPDDDYSFSRKGEATVSPYKQFTSILRDGPPLGIFTVIWCDTLANVQRTFDRQGLREFEMRVLFQMSPNDSSTLMDTPVASKLGMHRALLYTEDQGRLEKFRPYGLPPLEWLRSIAPKMQTV